MKVAHRVSELRTATAYGKPHQAHNDRFRRQIEEHQELKAQRRMGDLVQVLHARVKHDLREVSRPFWGATGWDDEGATGDELPTRPRPRRYLEAYPVLNSTATHRAFLSDHRLCVWREASGAVIGGAEVKWLSPHSLSVRFAVQRNRYQQGGSGELRLSLVFKGSLPNNQRALFPCPRCGQARSGLGLVGEGWACRNCHGLSYRSTLVSAAVRRAEKYERLSVELERLKTDGGPKRHIEKLAARVKAALRAAGRLPHPVSSQEYRYCVNGEWVAAPFSEDGYYDHLHGR